MKIDGWLDLLFAKVEERRARPQELGVWDCCQFAAECILVMTGVDHRTGFPEYHSEAEGQDILDEHGGMNGLLASVFGPSIPVARAKRGDLLELPDGACAICLGVTCVGTAPEGLRFRPAADAIAAWSID